MHHYNSGMVSGLGKIYMKNTKLQSDIFNVIYREGYPYLKENNPYSYDPAPEFASTEWSRFESKSEREALPLLDPFPAKVYYRRSEFDIVEAYKKDGRIVFDKQRPFYARNMAIKIIEAALPII